MKNNQLLKFAPRQLRPWILPIVLIILWQVLAKLGVISTRVLPAPSDVLQAGIRLARSSTLR